MTPGRDPRTKEAQQYTFVDLTTSFFRITELFRDFGLGIARAENGSTNGTEEDIMTLRLSFKKPALRLSILLANKHDHLRVSLEPRCTDRRYPGCVCVGCRTGMDQWTINALLNERGDKETSKISEITQRFDELDVQAIQTVGHDLKNISEQRAMAVITTMIEIFKGAEA